MLGYEGRNRRTLNFLKTIYFDRPEWVRCRVGLLPATWMEHREDLEAVVLSHPRVFPDHRRGSVDFDRAGGDRHYEEGRLVDCWGCEWKNIHRGMAGAPVSHPLADWSALDSYEPPDPMTQDRFGPRRDWDEVRAEMAAAKARGALAGGNPLPHGFMYMYLYYLRGFEDFMMDLATAEPRLERPIAMVEAYNAAVIRKYLGLGAEYLSFGDDLGLQRSLPMGPAAWRRWIKPSYARLLGPCRDAGAEVYLHTDGHILEIIPDLVETGVRVLNPQVRANGLDGLREAAKGRVAIDLDLDRQLFPFATPSECEDHVGEAVETLGSAEGGLTLKAEIAPDVPLQNLDALCRAFERICRLPEPETV